MLFWIIPLIVLCCSSSVGEDIIYDCEDNIIVEENQTARLKCSFSSNVTCGMYCEDCEIFWLHNNDICIEDFCDESMQIGGSENKTISSTIRLYDIKITKDYNPEGAWTCYLCGEEITCKLSIKSFDQNTVSCEAYLDQSNSSIVRLKCVVARVIPQACCTFFYYPENESNKAVYLNASSASNISGRDALYFSSECKANLLLSSLGEGYFEFWSSIYPCHEQLGFYNATTTLRKGTFRLILPKTINCHSKMMEDGCRQSVTIDCFGYDVYPEGRCVFSFSETENDTSKTLISKSALSQNQQSQVDGHGNRNFFVSCTLEIELDLLTLGSGASYQLFVKVFPHISGGEELVQWQPIEGVITIPKPRPPTLMINGETYSADSLQRVFTLQKSSNRTIECFQEDSKAGVLTLDIKCDRSSKRVYETCQGTFRAYTYILKKNDRVLSCSCLAKFRDSSQLASSIIIDVSRFFRPEDVSCEVKRFEITPKTPDMLNVVCTATTAPVFHYCYFQCYVDDGSNWDQDIVHEKILKGQLTTCVGNVSLARLPAGNSTIYFGIFPDVLPYHKWDEMDGYGIIIRATNVLIKQPVRGLNMSVNGKYEIKEQDGANVRKITLYKQTPLSIECLQEDQPKRVYKIVIKCGDTEHVSFTNNVKKLELKDEDLRLFWEEHENLVTCMCIVHFYPHSSNYTLERAVELEIDSKSHTVLSDVWDSVDRDAIILIVVLFVALIILTVGLCTVLRDATGAHAEGEGHTEQEKLKDGHVPAGTKSPVTGGKKKPGTASKHDDDLVDSDETSRDSSEDSKFTKCSDSEDSDNSSG